MVLFFLVLLAMLVSLAFVMQLLFCVIALPARNYHFRTPSAHDACVGALIHGMAYICALARLPFTIGPFLGKRACFLLVPARATCFWHHPAMQVLRMLGEGINLLLVALALDATRAAPTGLPAGVVAFIIGAEVVRLAAQKGQMLASASWQLLPHRTIARTLQHHIPWIARSGYCRYYQGNDMLRLRYLRMTLRHMVRVSPVAARRMAHFHAYRIVPDHQYLRSGLVRDIARGRVFIHRRWTNDPWLLLGLALRRAPWMFDPRELPRPFAYRTTANRIVTYFVLCHARWSPTFAWYQFGHEIKAASHAIVLHALHLIGYQHEAVVRADGTYPFESNVCSDNQDLLWTNAATLRDLQRRSRSGEQITTLAIAEQYAYPHSYVVDVLLPQLHRPLSNQEDVNADTIACAVASGASQCG